MTIKEHYVPQFYLRNFSSTNNMLWVYDRKKNKYFHSPTKDICYEKNLYETPWENANPKLGKFVLQNQLENEFAQQENEYNKILKKAINICSNPENKDALICSSSEKNILASFVINILLRNPWSLNTAKIDPISTAIIEHEDIKSIRDVVESIGMGGTKSLVEAAASKVWLDGGFAGSVPESLKGELLHLNCVFVATKSHQFITSSFPVQYRTFDTIDGITHIESIICPLNPNYALLYSINPVTKLYRNRLVTIPAKTTDLINSYYLKVDTEHTRFIIASEKSILESLVATN